MNCGGALFTAPKQRATQDHRFLIHRGMSFSPLAEALWSLAPITFAIAVIATATIQLLKDLIPARRWFQRSFLEKWLLRRLAERQFNPKLRFSDAEKDLVHLATGGDSKAFYDLETAQLCGQMNSAAQIALAYASRHRGLLNYLAPEADPDDIEMIASTPNTSVPSGEEPSGAQAQGVSALLDARNRVAHHLQRTIDALQISMGFRWKLYLQSAAYLICFVGSFTAVSIVSPGGRDYFIQALMIGIVAGFFAPVVSDLGAVINRLKKP